MEENNRKLRTFKFNKKDMLEYAKHNIEQNQEFEIDYYIKNFQYNGETLEEIDKIISNWEGREVLYKYLYYNKKVEEDKKTLDELTDEFIISDIKNDDDVLVFLNKVAKILEKYRELFFGRITPRYKQISNKLKENGYNYKERTHEELKKYDKNYEVMACLIDEDQKDILSNILISDSMNCFNRNFFDPKIYRGINEYYKRFIMDKEKSKVKVK